MTELTKFPPTTLAVGWKHYTRLSAKPQYPPAFSTCQEHKLALLSTGSCVCLLDFSERGSGSGSRSHRSYFVDERPYLGNAKSVVRIVVENTFREKTTRTTSANA